jgi:GntR family histidine utilization transcriptional repressor
MPGAQDRDMPTPAGGGALSWQAVRAEVLRRIRARDWAPGAQIPHEADLARELGCARATVNRALRELAQSGVIERRRRVGSRVALHPVRKATLDIPVLRLEIEARGGSYDFALLRREMLKPPTHVQALFGDKTEPLLHVLGVHSENGSPHALEDRWIDPAAVPTALRADFAAMSPNEWLVLNVAFERGDIAFSAAMADAEAAQALGCGEGEALFVTERVTWHGERPLTHVRLSFAPGHRMRAEL